MNLELTPLEAPQGAQWWGFTSAALGGLGEKIFTSDGPTVLANPARTHMHLNWAFTQPGTYCLQVRAVVPTVSAFRSAPGEALASAPTTVTFEVVGKSADTAGGTDAAPGGSRRVV